MRARQPRILGNKTLDAAAATAVLSQAEEQRLARLAQAGDRAAFAQLVHAHLRLVYSMVYGFRSFKLPFDDLVSEGLIGLIIACRRFDPERGTRLATYATHWIRAQLRSYTLTNRRIVRSPSTRNARKVLAQLGKTQRQLTQSHGEVPDNALLAHALGVKTRDVEEITTALRARDLPYGVEVAGRTFEVASDAVSPESLALETEARMDSARRLEQALLRLAPRERRILEQRCFTDCTLEELGRELGISRERVRQLEARAKADMRKDVTQREIGLSL